MFKDCRSIAISILRHFAEKSVELSRNKVSFHFKPTKMKIKLQTNQVSELEREKSNIEKKWDNLSV